MASRHLVDPDFRPLLDLLPSFDLTTEALPAIREQLIANILSNAPPPDQRIRLEEREIDGLDGLALRMLVYRPIAPAGRLPVLLHFHPGGYIMGSPRIRDTRNRHLSQVVQCVIVSVEYRLAPEAPFPAALHDGYAALRWIFDHGEDLGVDTSRIAVAGESAGGGVAAGVVQMAHDRNEVPVLMQLLTYPMLDNRTGGTVAAAESCGEFVWTATSNRFAWAALLGDDHLNRSLPDYAAPGRRGDVAGLPPAFIAVGSLDLFAEENIDYATRLLRAGVPTQLHVFPGAFHGFDSNPNAWAAKAYLDLFAGALSRGFERAQQPTDA